MDSKTFSSIFCTCHPAFVIIAYNCKVKIIISISSYFAISIISIVIVSIKKEFAVAVILVIVNGLTGKSFADNVFIKVLQQFVRIPIAIQRHQ